GIQRQQPIKESEITVRPPCAVESKQREGEVSKGPPVHRHVDDDTLGDVERAAAEDVALVVQAPIDLRELNPANRRRATDLFPSACPQHLTKRLGRTLEQRTLGETEDQRD